MAEIRHEDLRFSRKDTAVFLLDVMGLILSNDEISALEVRTEGWIAGLQLAALSILGFVVITIVAIVRWRGAKSTAEPVTAAEELAPTH